MPPETSNLVGERGMENISATQGLSLPFCKMGGAAWILPSRCCSQTRKHMGLYYV